MNFIAYILFILQVLSIYGSISRSNFWIYCFDLFNSGVLYFIGHFLPTILGIVLLILHGKRKRKKNMVTDKDLEKNPTLEYWTCSNCGTRNRMKVSSCQKCDYSKVWSDEHSKN